VTTLTQALPLPEAPYRGIEPFRYIDQKIFSVREDETWDLLSKILIYRGVLLYGDSGSGKSSLINAGLIPGTADENLIAHRLRIQPRKGAEIKLERIPIASGDGPPFLPTVFLEEGSAKSEALSLELSLEEFYERLNDVRENAGGKARPLLIFDQFEEFITLFDEALHGGETEQAKRAQKEAPEVQNAILAMLTMLIEDSDLPVKVLFVFREEYLAKLDLLFKACPQLLDQYVRLLPPRVDLAHQIIRAPFLDDEQGAKFVGKREAQELSDALAGAIALQLQKRSESGYVNLTELQIICRKLWESPDADKLFQKMDGEIQKIVEDYYLDVLKKLGDLYDPAIALLGQMVTSSNTRNIISQPDLLHLEKDSFSPEVIESALAALVKRRLIRCEPRHKTDFYEIASEFLVPWILQKKGERIAQIEAGKLAAETEQKLKQAESEQRLKQAYRERRNLLIGATVLGLLLIVAVLLIIKAFRLQRETDQARDVAIKAQAQTKREKEFSENVVRLMKDLTSPAAELRLAAVRDLVVLHQSGDLPRELTRTVLSTIQDEKNEEIIRAALPFYSSIVAESEINPEHLDLTDPLLLTAKQKSAELAGAQSAKVPPRVYIQIASNDQRARADKIAAALRSLSFTVPDYEVAGSRAPKNNQLRYYKSDDAASSYRNDLLRKLREVDGETWSGIQLERSSSARPGHFELWFASQPAATATPIPSPTSEQRVALTLKFQDEQGNPVRVQGLTVSIEEIPFSGTEIKNTPTFTLRPGRYLMFVQVEGHPVYRREINIQQSQIHTVTLEPGRRAAQSLTEPRP